MFLIIDTNWLLPYRKALFDAEQDVGYEPMPETERPGGFHWGGVHNEAVNDNVGDGDR